MSKPNSEIYADVVIIGFGSAGGCAAIEARDAGAEVVVLEKQPEEAHHSNTRMSGGGFHSPDPGGDFESLKAYAKAMFSGDNLPYKLEGEQSEFADELADLWARYAPQNAPFMRSLDPAFQAVVSASRLSAVPRRCAVGICRGTQHLYRTVRRGRAYRAHPRRGQVGKAIR